MGSPAVLEPQNEQGRGGSGRAGMDGAVWGQLTAEMPRQDQAGEPGLILAPLGFYLTTSILGKLPLGKYREGRGGGRLGQVLEAARPL